MAMIRPQRCRRMYGASLPEPGDRDDVLVVSVHGKGIVLRPDSLRPATERGAG
jgi:hypothetical protein